MKGGIIMEKIKEFIKKYKAEILIILSAISGIAASLASTDAKHAVIYSIVIAVVASLVEVLKNGITESSITLFAKAIEIIIQELSKKDTVTKSMLDSDKIAVSADEGITVDEIKEELRKALK